MCLGARQQEYGLCIYYKSGRQYCYQECMELFLYDCNYANNTNVNPEDFYKNDSLSSLPSEGIGSAVDNILYTVSMIFPYEELLEINHKPWQEYINASDQNLSQGIGFYKHCLLSYIKEYYYEPYDPPQDFCVCRIGNTLFW
ncbi:MAG: hypothetical protein QHH06_12210 [Clostridiales bacterium]|nr:hypothetical protein [Eubacteriales bacterium]MDH7567216.1 hypothetical protein [Clostridiales bacterium]